MWLHSNLMARWQDVLMWRHDGHHSMHYPIKPGSTMCPPIMFAIISPERLDRSRSKCPCPSYSFGSPYTYINDAGVFMFAMATTYYEQVKLNDHFVVNNWERADVRYFMCLRVCCFLDTENKLSQSIICAVFDPKVGFHGPPNVSLLSLSLELFISSFSAPSLCVIQPHYALSRIESRNVKMQNHNLWIFLWLCHFHFKWCIKITTIGDKCISFMKIDWKKILREIVRGGDKKLHPPPPPEKTQTKNK